MDPVHKQLLELVTDQAQSEIPWQIHQLVRREAVDIVGRTHDAYKSMLGSKHEMTKQAATQLKLLEQQLE